MLCLQVHKKNQFYSDSSEKWLCSIAIKHKLKPIYMVSCFLSVLHAGRLVFLIVVNSEPISWTSTEEQGHSRLWLQFCLFVSETSWKNIPTMSLEATEVMIEAQQMDFCLIDVAAKWWLQRQVLALWFDRTGSKNIYRGRCPQTFPLAFPRRTPPTPPPPPPPLFERAIKCEWIRLVKWMGDGTLARQKSQRNTDVSSCRGHESAFNKGRRNHATQPSLKHRELTSFWNI